MLDMIFSGLATNADVGDRLAACNFDPQGMRPFVHNGKSYMTVNGKSFVTNAPGTLTYDQWKHIDSVVVKAAKPRLRIVEDLRAAGLTFNLPGGMGTSVLIGQTQSDIGPATISMNGIRVGDNDRPQYNQTILPIPVIHKDFSLDLRDILASRKNGGQGLDLAEAELAARRIAEEAEQLFLGNRSATYAGGTVYGYKNFPSRITASITTPVTGGWTGATLVTEIGNMKKAASDAGHYGPYMVYYGPAWSTYMNNDYSTAKGENTLRDRVAKIENIKGVQQADYLTGYDILLVQMTSDTIQLVEGMGLTTLQWDSHGGLRKNFKLMAIWVPRTRADYNGQCGIVHAA